MWLKRWLSGSLKINKCGAAGRGDDGEVLPLAVRPHVAMRGPLQVVDQREGGDGRAGHDAHGGGGRLVTD